MNKMVDDLKFDAFMSGFRAGFPVSPGQLWHSSNTGIRGSNTWNFKDTEVDEWIGQFDKEFDSEKRKALGQKIHKRIYNSHAVLFHHEGGGCYKGRSKDLHGFRIANSNPDCVYWPWWYKTN